MGGWGKVVIELEKNGKSKVMVVDVKQLPDNIHEPESKIWLHKNGQDQPLCEQHWWK
jgi:hypothetical protein